MTVGAEQMFGDGKKCRRITSLQAAAADKARHIWSKQFSLNSAHVCLGVCRVVIKAKTESSLISNRLTPATLSSCDV